MVYDVRIHMAQLFQKIGLVHIVFCAFFGHDTSSSHSLIHIFTTRPL